MSMPWLNEYVGLPYLAGGRTAAGVDCYGLVRLVLTERAGAVMPLMETSPDASAPRMVRALTYGTQQMVNEGHAARIYAPHDLAIIVLRMGEIADHCGLCVGDFVLHAHRQYATSLIEWRPNFERLASAVEFYQWQP